MPITEAVSQVLPLVSFVPRISFGGRDILSLPTLPTPPPQPEPAIGTNEKQVLHPPVVTKNSEYLRGCRNGLRTVFAFSRRRGTLSSDHGHHRAKPRSKGSGDINSTTMCYGRCARCIGHSLVWLATLCIVANILLYFPHGETKYASDNHLSRFVWFFSGILGGGLLVSRSEIITALKKISFLLDEMFSWKVFYKACFQIQDFCSFLF